MAKSPRAKSALSGKVQTVLGPIEPSALGITQTHEHLLIDTGCYFEMPEEASERAWVGAPVTMDRLGGIGRRWNYACNNGQLYDERIAVEEVLRYRHAGGNSLVDTTSIGIARDPLALTRMSRATGLNVIMGASHYVPLSYPAGMDRRSEDAIAAQIIRDVTVGVGDTGVKAGIIGEIGNLWPTNDNTLKVLRASARASVETGAPISIHPGFHRDSPPSILETLLEAGASADRIIMGHLDFFHDRGLLRELSQSGCYLEWDLFGVEDTTLGQLAGQDLVFASDVQRMGYIEDALDHGAGGRVVVGHDICMKMQYVRYGGKSYPHILENVVPRMRKRGFTEKQVNAILVDNPARVLAFV